MVHKMRAVMRLIPLLAILLSACNLNTSSQNNAVNVSGEPQVRIVSPLPNATYLEGVT
ncbi:MAG: hypothetical protein IAE80_06885, partial [Anaerolinea sp.]|nr:hypothetical protein [Anaerolinea sp.]